MSNPESEFEYLYLNVPADAAVAQHNQAVLHALWWDPFETSAGEQAPYCSEYVLLSFLQENNGVLTIEWLQHKQTEIETALAEAEVASQQNTAEAERDLQNAADVLSSTNFAMLPSAVSGQMQAQFTANFNTIQARSSASVAQFYQQNVLPLQQMLAEFQSQYARLLQIPTRFMMLRRPVTIAHAQDLANAETMVATITSSPPSFPAAPLLRNPAEPEFIEYGKQYEISGAIIGGLASAMALMTGVFSESYTGIGLFPFLGLLSIAVFTISVLVIIGRRVVHSKKKAMVRKIQENDERLIRSWESKCESISSQYQTAVQAASDNLEQFLR